MPHYRLLCMQMNIFTSGMMKLCVSSRKYRRRIAFWAAEGRFCWTPWCEPQVQLIYAKEYVCTNIIQTEVYLLELFDNVLVFVQERFVCTIHTCDDTWRSHSSENVSEIYSVSGYLWVWVLPGFESRVFRFFSFFTFICLATSALKKDLLLNCGLTQYQKPQDA